MGRPASGEMSRPPAQIMKQGLRKESSNIVVTAHQMRHAACDATQRQKLVLSRS